MLVKVESFHTVNNLHEQGATVSSTGTSAMTHGNLSNSRCSLFGATLSMYCNSKAASAIRVECMHQHPRNEQELMVLTYGIMCSHIAIYESVALCIQVDGYVEMFVHKNDCEMRCIDGESQCPW